MSARKKNKVFVIGFNKTGTTSMSKALKDMGYVVAPQNWGEHITIPYILGDKEKLYKLTDRYEAFQDNPFTLPSIYKDLYSRYSDAKFILTIRKDPDTWYNSIVRFHTNLFSSDKNRPPNATDLKTAFYVENGWLYKMMKFKFNVSDQNMYDKQKLINRYNSHIIQTTNFFKNNPNRLLVLDLSSEDSYKKLCEFLGKKYDENKKIPHLNISS